VTASGSALPRKSSGRSRNVRTPANVERVRASIEQSPRRSARNHAAALRISDRTVRQILHADLRMHPYKMMVAQELSVTDWETRRTLSEDILQHVPPTPVLWCSDEAHFHLSGTVNKQHFRYWAENNPHDLHQRPLDNPRVTVWCDVSRLGAVRPYFFEEGGETVTVASNRYCEMLENFLRPRLEEFDDSEDVWFQQDVATAHTARRSLGILREIFPSRLVSLRGDIEWPARSPDLTPCDFCLWGYLKVEVYKHRPQTLKALKDAIREEGAAIPPEMTNTVIENFRERLRQCITNNGRHLSDVIFKT